MIWLDNGLICELIDLIVPLIKRMNAVGKLGSYISRGVVTVSAPFHPFGGAVDIVVVEQEDGSLKSSPWYVQFGKFQGVLKAREKVVTVNVNGVDADFLMYLDNRGGAHFLREVDGDEEMSESIGSSGGDNKDGSSCIRTPQKNMSCNNELHQAKLVSEFGASSQKKLSRSISTGPRVLGFVFGRRSWKENRLKHQENVVRRDREGSLERAEMAADLLEVRWSTSLATRKHRKDSTLRNSSIHHEKINEMDICRLSPQSNGFHDKGEAGIPVNYMESFTLKEAYLDLDVFESLVGFNGVDTRTNSNSVKAGVGSNGDEQSSTAQALQSGDEKRMERVESIIYCEASERFIDDGSSGESSENLCSGCSVSGEMDVPAEVLGDDRELISKVDSAFSFSILECKMGMDRDNPEDKDPCRSIDMSKSDSATSSDIENVLETEVDVVVERKTNESPIKFVEEIVVNQTPTNLTNSFLIEATSSILDSKENSRSQKLSSPTSSDLDHLGSYEESKSQDLEESSEDNVGLLAKNPDNTQFNFNDFDGSECTKTMGTHPIALDSLEAENDPQYHPKCSEEKLAESTGVLDESHAFTGQLIQEILRDDHPSNPEMSKTVSRPITIVRNHELADQTAQTVKSLPRFWSHEAEINAQGANCLVSRSLDSSLDNLSLAQGDFPTALENGEQKQQSIPRHSSMEHMQISEELRKILSDPAVEISLCRHMLYKGMGQEAAARAFDSEKLDLEKLVSLGSEILRNDRLVVRIGGLYFPWDAALPIISAIGSPTGEQILEPKGMISVDQVENGIEWDPTQSVDSKLATAAQQGTGGTTDTLKTAIIKKNKMMWSKTPTSEQLASLNLKEGRNEVTFTFSTPMLGEQKVDARIYLWKWNVRIVISDVDGTITKSDVLGQFMPLVGVDWSHIGVAHLFSAIKENGYELLFLSARAISQASLTRQFLFNLKQDGKALPEGPVFISPDGLLPSLIREVIRRAPHEFKIACLEDIRALFPPHHNPFYAGFGNRDTDELSYLKVGIPKGKIFIINPKGEVAVQRRVDRKTYTSLHTLVHDMFPPSSSVSSSEQEDFNSWNFWRLPPPETVV